MRTGREKLPGRSDRVAETSEGARVLSGSSYSAVQEFMDAFWQGAVGGAGVILIILGLRRDDAIRPIFLVVGIALAIFGLGGQFFGLKL